MAKKKLTKKTSSKSPPTPRKFSAPVSVAPLAAETEAHRTNCQAENEVESPLDMASLMGRSFGTLLADPPWQFQNRTGKVAPEHRRLSRYGTLSTDEIASMPVSSLAAERAHLYLWVPNALLPEGLRVMAAWGFTYKANLVWHKIRKDGGPDGRGVGFYFRNTTELVLFGVRGANARTLAPGRRQVNIIKSMKREHSRKPDELYSLIEECSWGPYLELFARGPRPGWDAWGDQSVEYAPSWKTYSFNSVTAVTDTDAQNVKPAALRRDTSKGVPAASLRQLPARKKNAA